MREKKRQLPIPMRLTPLALYFSAVFYFLWPSFAYAYIDPATTSYLIQIAAGLVITLSVAIGVLFSRIKMIIVLGGARISAFFVRQGKKTDSSVESTAQDTAHGQDTGEGDHVHQPHTVSSPEELPHVIQSTAELRARPARKKEKVPAADLSSLGWMQRAQLHWNDKRRLRIRLLLTALLSFAVSFTFFIFGPMDLVIGSRGEMGYGIGDIAPTILIIGLVVFVALFVVLSLLRGDYLDVVTTTVFALLICGYVQGTFLNEGLTSITGEVQSWHTMYVPMLQNLLIWIGILILVFFIRSLMRARMIYLIMSVSALLVLMQGVALFSEIPPADKHYLTGVQGTSLTTAGEFELTPGHNVIVFLLDECDVGYTLQLEEEEPGYFDRLDGFTEYTNNVWIHTDTNPSVPEILTGIPFDWNQDVYEWQAEVYPNSRLLNPLREEDYGVKLYLDEVLDYPQGRADILEGTADNIGGITTILRERSAAKTLIKMSAYRFSPLTLKPFFWIAPSEYTDDTEKLPQSHPQYTIDDPLFNEQLRENGLNIVDEEHENQFVFYHMNGPHTPFFTDENTQVIPDSEGTATKSLKGCFNYIYYYLDELKSLGKYEDSTIVILADHGNRRAVNHERDEPTVPICFVKPAGAAGTPFARSAAPLVTENVRATILNDAGIPLEPEQITCEDAPEQLDVARPVVCRYGKSGEMPYYVTTFEVTGDASDWNNWHLDEKRETDIWA